MHYKWILLSIFNRNIKSKMWGVADSRGGVQEEQRRRIQRTEGLHQQNGHSDWVGAFSLLRYLGFGFHSPLLI